MVYVLTELTYTKLALIISAPGVHVAVAAESKRVIVTCRYCDNISYGVLTSALLAGVGTCYSRSNSLYNSAVNTELTVVVKTEGYNLARAYG